MNRFLSKFLLLALFLWASPSFAAWAFINQVKATGVSACTETVTTPSTNMTGADTFFMIISQSDGAGADPVSISDSSSNSYTKILRATNSGDSDVGLWRASSATAGSSMTFTVGGSGIAYCFGIIVLGFSGGHASPDDLTRSNSADAVVTLAAGSSSLTPSENNELVIAGLSFVTAGDTVTINGGFSTVFKQDAITNVTYGFASSYLIQTTATSANPSFSWNTSGNPTTLLASFKSAAGGGGGGGGGNGKALLLGVGR